MTAEGNTVSGQHSLKMHAARWGTVALPVYCARLSNLSARRRLTVRRRPRSVTLLVFCIGQAARGANLAGRSGGPRSVVAAHAAPADAATAVHRLYVMRIAPTSF